MSPTSILIISRRLLQVHPFNGNPESSTNNSAAAAAGDPLDHMVAFDCSMVPAILVLLIALFFIAFFSFYLRRFLFAAMPPPPPPPPNHKCGGGLGISAVKSLPLIAYGTAARHRMIDDCSICLSEFGEMETVKLIPYCAHVFHPSCIDTWLALHVTCPLCRSAKLFLDVAPDESSHRAPESFAVEILPRGGTPE